MRNKIYLCLICAVLLFVLPLMGCQDAGDENVKIRFYDNENNQESYVLENSFLFLRKTDFLFRRLSEKGPS